MNQEQFQQGLLWCELNDSSDWIKRRVETLSFVDESRYSLKTSVDIDINAIFGLAKKSALDPSQMTEIPVPIARLSKNPELALDVFDSKNHVVSAVSSDLTDTYTLNYFLVRLWSEGFTDPSSRV